MEFVACQMKFGADELSCGEKHLPEKQGTIQQCVDSDIGRNLQLEAEKMTDALAPSFVPSIVYNGRYDQDLQARSLRDFKHVVCDLLRKAPSICTE